MTNEETNEMLRKMETLNLTTAENTSVIINDDGGEINLESAVVGKILTSKPYNQKALANTMGIAWGTSRTMQYEYIGNNLFLFKLQNLEDRNKVLNGGPWNFRNYPIILVPFDQDMRISELEFKYMPIWVRMLDLPLGVRSEKAIRQIGEMCGAVIQVDKNMWGEFVRIRISLDITNPIRRGVFIKTARSKHEKGDWFELKYEKLPFFCYFCGLLGAEICGCKSDGSKGISQIRYTETLRVASQNHDITVQRISASHGQKQTTDSSSKNSTFPAMPLDVDMQIDSVLNWEIEKNSNTSDGQPENSSRKHKQTNVQKEFEPKEHSIESKGPEENSLLNVVSTTLGNVTNELESPNSKRKRATSTGGPVLQLTMGEMARPDAVELSSPEHKKSKLASLVLSSDSIKIQSAKAAGQPRRYQ